jgi:hypothetical protein
MRRYFAGRSAVPVNIMEERPWPPADHQAQHLREDHMQHTTPLVRRDTAAWRLQVWISFGLSLSLCGIGLAWLPGEDLDRAFMVMGYIFCLSAAFVLAKFIRDNQDKPVDTPMWKMVVWSAFALAMGLTGWGLWRMEIQPVWKAYLLVCWFYLISNVFTLAKMLRDAHDADVAEARYQGRRQAMHENATPTA